MVKKLIRHGNSCALIIDKPILELLKITNETTFELSTDGKNLILSPLIEDNQENISLRYRPDPATCRIGRTQ